MAEPTNEPISQPANQPASQPIPPATISPAPVATPTPGDTIAPAAAPTPIAPVSVPAPVALPVPAPVAQPITPEPTTDTHPVADRDGSITWTASEFVAHDKSASWYTKLAAVAALGAGLVYLLTKDLVSSAVIIFSAAILGVYGSRQPRQLQYRISDQGLSVGQKHFSFEEFQSFTVAQDGAFSSIIFRPHKRFATLTTIYYAPEDEELIVDILSDRLPFEEHSPDAVDRLMRRIRF